MGELEHIREMVKTRSTKELREQSDDYFTQKGLIKTSVFGWLTEDEFNFIGTAMRRAGYTKTPDELTGIPCEEAITSETNDRRDVVQRRITKVLPAVFTLQDMIKEREERDRQIEYAKNQNLKEIMKNEPPVKQEQKIHPCPICQSDKFKPGQDYVTVKWAYCDNCGALYDQVSGKTKKEMD